jgi:hypothetical protein
VALATCASAHHSSRSDLQVLEVPEKLIHCEYEKLKTPLIFNGSVSISVGSLSFPTNAHSALYVVLIFLFLFV